MNMIAPSTGQVRSALRLPGQPCHAEIGLELVTGTRPKQRRTMLTVTSDQ